MQVIGPVLAVTHSSTRDHDIRACPQRGRTSQPGGATPGMATVTGFLPEGEPQGGHKGLRMKCKGFNFKTSAMRFAAYIGRHPAIVLGCVLAVVTALIYAPSLQGEFVYDDRVQIRVMDYLHKPAHFLDVLSFRVLARDVLDRNRPVQLLSLMLDAAVWGRIPFGYRLTNLGLHITASLLVFAVSLRLIRKGGPPPAWYRAGAAAAGALFFAVHPIMVETVSAASFREDLLACCFTLGALLLASFYPAKRGSILLGVTGCTLLAVGSKETGAAVPVLIAAYWLVFRDRSARRAWLFMIGLSALVVGAFLAARFVLTPHESTIFLDAAPRLGGSLPATLKIQPRIWVFQVQTLLNPLSLSADYGPYSLRHIGFPLALMVLTGVAVAVGAWSWFDRRVLFAAACYIVPILPVSNLLPMYRPLADRYLYLPMVGIALAIVFATESVGRRSHSWIWPLCAAGFEVAVLLVLGGLTVQRVHVWQDRRALWLDTVQKNPVSITAQNNLAFALLDAGRPYLANEHWQKALQISNGKHADAWAGLALGLQAMSQERHASRALSKAIDLEPRYGDPHALRHSLFWDEEDARRLLEIRDMGQDEG